MSVVIEQAPTTPDVSAPRLLHVGWQDENDFWHGLCGLVKHGGPDRGSKVPPGHVICETCEWEAAERGWFF